MAAKKIDSRIVLALKILKAIFTTIIILAGLIVLAPIQSIALHF